MQFRSAHLFLGFVASLQQTTRVAAQTVSGITTTISVVPNPETTPTSEGSLVSVGDQTLGGIPPGSISILTSSGSEPTPSTAPSAMPSFTQPTGAAMPTARQVGSGAVLGLAGAAAAAAVLL